MGINKCEYTCDKCGQEFRGIPKIGYTKILCSTCYNKKFLNHELVISESKIKLVLCPKCKGKGYV